MGSKQIQIFEASKMTLPEAIEESLASLNDYGSRFDHWVVAFSGGKDSTATITLIAWAIKTGKVKAPKSLTVLFANTKMELTPLYAGAVQLMQELTNDGFNCIEVVPKLDHRFFVYILGRGVPPPNNNRRWCTTKLKIRPMMEAVAGLTDKESTLKITGLRLGESRSRDERISVACSKDTGECGQGFFQVALNEDGHASLAPLVHWRVCNVFDWLYFEQTTHGYPVKGIVTVYGDDDIRTGCIKCELVTQDKPLNKVAKMPEWEHLGILNELGDVYDYLNRWDNRLRMPLRKNKSGTFMNKTGKVGPLKMKARQHALKWIKDIQERAGVTLIDAEEETRIRELWELNTWPQGWDGTEPGAEEEQPIYRVISKGPNKGKVYTIQQPLTIEGA